MRSKWRRCPATPTTLESSLTFCRQLAWSSRWVWIISRWLRENDWERRPAGRPGERWDDVTRLQLTPQRQVRKAVWTITENRREERKGKKIEGCGARKGSCSRRIPFRHQFSPKNQSFIYARKEVGETDRAVRPVRGWCAPRDSNPFPSLAMQRRGEENKKEPDNNVQGISFPCRLQTRCSDALAGSCRYSVF